MSRLKKALMHKFDWSEREAEEAINDAREQIFALLEDDCIEEAWDFLMEEFGLEPDYLEDILF